MSEYNKDKSEIATSYEEKRYKKIINHILYICRLAGFEVVDRIVLRDKKTGKVWH